VPTSRRFIPSALFGLLLACSGSACSASDEPAVEKPTPAPASDSALPTPAEGALPTPAEGALPEFDRLTLAKEKLGDAARASYSVTTTDGAGTLTVREVGAYSLFPTGSFSLRSAPGETPEQLTSISVGPDVWLQAGRPDEALGGCWAHRQLDGNQVTAMLVGPVPRVLLTHAEVTGETESEVVATMAPTVLVPLFPESIVTRIGSLNETEGAAPVTYLMAGEDLTGYRVSLDDLLVAAEAVGAEPDPRLANLDLQVEVNLDQVGEAVPVEKPDPGQQVELGPRESVAEGLQRCDQV
jgi:hypothetical protein